jgi:hypothetical protein
MEEWKEFEILVRNVQSQLAKNAIVTHNVNLTGKSGAKNQCDVIIESEIGQIHFLGIIECKKYKTKIGIDIVRGFLSKINDLSAMKGIVVSEHGFTSEAELFAASNNIDLYSFVDAENIEWQNIGLIPISVIRVQLENASITAIEKDTGRILDLETALVKHENADIIINGNCRYNIESFAEYIWDTKFIFDSRLSEENKEQQIFLDSGEWEILYV